MNKLKLVQAPTPKSSCNPRVLLVDDNEDIPELLADHLGHHCQLEIVTCVSALHALQHFATGVFDAIVSDNSMPGMSGQDLLGTLAESHPRTRRILLTAYGSSDLLRQCKPYCSDVLDKSLDWTIVCEKICRHAREAMAERLADPDAP